MIRVTVWNENVHERENKAIANLYPKGIHGAIAASLEKHKDLQVRTATLQQPEHGLTEEVLDKTDVLMWWGHKAHGDVADAIVDRVQMKVLNGMGLVVMHSGHFSKVFKRLMGTGCGLRWREAGERERIWVANPFHPIAKGMGAYIEVPNTEMYGEYFDVPDPDELVFISWFEGGDVFRSGAVWHRGRGKVFYFRPGHETYPVYHNKDVLDVLARGVRYVAFQGNDETHPFGVCRQEADPLEEIEQKNFEKIDIEHPEESLQ